MPDYSNSYDINNKTVFKAWLKSEFMNFGEYEVKTKKLPLEGSFLK